MDNQTPPVVTEVSSEGLDQVVHDQLRKADADDKPTLQYILGHPDLALRMGRIFSGLVAEYRNSLPLIERPPFATIQVGNLGEDVDALLRDFAVVGIYIGVQGNDLIGRPEFALVLEPAKLHLNMATNDELGGAVGRDYSGGCTVAQSFAALKEIDAVKLPPEAGARYRLQYPDLPLGELRLMYQERIPDSAGRLKVFGVECGFGGYWLDGYCADPNDFYGGKVVWLYGGDYPVASD